MARIAPLALSEGPLRQQRSILTLDKSDEPFAIQIAQACKILDIDVHDKWKAFLEAGGEQIPRLYTTFDPRSEWALRWLLKKFQTGKEEPPSPCLYFKAWFLLRQLIIRIPLSKTAGILKTYNFITIVRKTLQWYRENLNRGLSVPSREGGGGQDTSDASSGIVYSSSSESRTSRKRKRDSTEVPISSSTPSTTTGAVDTLYMAVCATIAQVEALTKDSDHTQGFAVEHIKSALRSSSQDAALVLGSSLYLTNHLLQEPNRISERRSSSTFEARKRLENTAYRFCVSSVVELWSTRSLSRQDPHDNESNRAFRAHCMLPALQLLNRCRECSSPEKDMEMVTSSLEEMLIKHVILPYRASIFDTETPGQIRAGGTSTSLSQDLVSILTTFRFPLPGEVTVIDRRKSSLERSVWKTEAQHIITLLSLLFDVALGSSPRKTPKLRRIEDPWLEKLFSQLAECAATFLSGINAFKAQRYYVTLVKWMMEKAVKGKLHLSLPTTETILDQVSGLFSSGTDATVQWSVISLCIQNDANVFIVPASSANSDHIHLYRTPNKYLSSLLFKITEGQMESSSDYDHVRSHVIIPLCNAFADARNLTGFIQNWKEQLRVLRKRLEAQRDDIDDGPSIWEDDQLLQAVSQLVEPAFTASQIDQILSAAVSDLTPSISNMPNDKGGSLAGLVIIDSLFAGINQDETMAKLTESAQSVFSLLGVLLSGASSQTYRWRIWRIKATIADQWLTLHDSSVFKRKAHSAICTASERINQISSENLPDKKKDLSEELHAFRFILRFAAKGDSFWESLQFSSRSQVESAVKKIMDEMEPFCHRVSHDHFKTIKIPDTVPRWDEFSIKIISVDTLYLGCVADVLTSSSVINCLDASIQIRLIEQLYWCAVYQQRLSQSMSSGSIDYSWPWKMLHHPDVLGEHASILKHLRSFQVDHYLSISNFGEPKYWDIGTADYALAFSSIQTIPVQALERGHRSVIANRIFRILLYAKIPSLAITAAHLTMLAKLLTMPNKSMDILANAKEVLKKGNAQINEEAALIRLAYGIDGVIHWTTDTVNSVDALRTVTRSVMSYLFSTFEQQSSLNYLQIFYDQMSGLLEHKYEDKTNCTAALSAMIEESLGAYSRHRNKLPKNLDEIRQTLDTARLYHLETILDLDDRQIFSLVQTPDQRHFSGVNLECLAGYSDLLGIHPNLTQVSLQLFGDGGPSGLLKAISANFNGNVIERSWKDSCGVDYLIARLARVELLLDARDSNLHPNVLRTSRKIQEMKSAKEKNNILDSLREIMPSLRLQSKAQLFFEYGLDVDKCLTYSELYLVGIAIASIKDQDIEELRDSISRTFTLLCRALFHQIAFRDCILTMQCISMLLQKHPRIITQWHIDNLLSAITAKSSQVEDRINEGHMAMLYIGLCRLFGNILAIHRTKIGGRYHLIILTLQSILRCLFIPYTLTSSPSGSPSAFTETHAAAYARLLTTLCDPTVSSVTRSKKRSRLELNDETKKAKHITGQHLPYLIMEYCQCQLKGRLLPEMKAALDPGLYAVLAVLSPEVMRTMNAAMDESGRAVWKALYEDYRRLGRSGGT